MARGKVAQITFNVQKMSKAGKAYSVTALKYFSDKGSAKTENIFDSATYAGVVKQLAVGDEIDVTYVKNGEFFNVSDIKLVSKGSGDSSPPFTPDAPKPATYTPSSSWGGESVDKQSSIQRQNALTNATNLVAAMVAQEMYKKTTKISILMDEILKIADVFDGYTSGRTKIEALESTVPTTTSKKSTSSEPEFDDSDSEFPE